MLASLVRLRQSRPELLEQFRMRTGAHEDNYAGSCPVVDLISQKKITSDMALAMPVPIATQGMIVPSRTKRAIVGDQKQHHFLEAVHVVPPGS